MLWGFGPPEDAVGYFSNVADPFSITLVVQITRFMYITFFVSAVSLVLIFNTVQISPLKLKFRTLCKNSTEAVVSYFSVNEAVTLIPAFIFFLIFPI